ncbi:MAG: hypothetical protein KGM42_10750 [Hyphomicrobiales bacterium]|nr:hypothetical protein [Hyphomicrobiales bacterium]
MKTISIVAVCVALAGCASIQKTTAWLAAPTTTQAAANLKTMATAFDCGIVVSGAALGKDIAEIVGAGQATIGTSGKVYAISAAICTSLGGAPSARPVAVQ